MLGPGFYRNLSGSDRQEVIVLESIIIALIPWMVSTFRADPVQCASVLTRRWRRFGEVRAPEIGGKAPLYWR